MCGEEMDEQAWIREARAGNETAFNQLVLKYDGFVQSHVAFYIERLYVHDIAQEIWIKVYQKLWQLEDPDKWVPWLRKLIYHQCVNYRKQLYRKRQWEVAIGLDGWNLLLDMLTDDDFPIPVLLERQELKQMLVRELDQLPGDYGFILRLRYFQEISYEEIARLTGLALSVVKWRIHQGKKLLKARLLKNIKWKGTTFNV